MATLQYPSAYNRRPPPLRFVPIGSARVCSRTVCIVGIHHDLCLFVWFTTHVGACSAFAVSRWLFEECDTFLEVSGAIAFYHFSSEIHPGILTMWGHLRRYALYFLHYRPGQHTHSQIRDAQREIFKFAEYAEENLQCSMLTCLIHRCFAHIPTQVQNSLPGAYLREDFGERMVRWTKGFIKGHATRRAAESSAGVCLTQMALRILKNDNPGIDGPLNQIRTRVPTQPLDRGDDYGTALHQLNNANTGDDNDEVCCACPAMCLVLAYASPMLRLC